MPFPEYKPITAQAVEPTAAAEPIVAVQTELVSPVVIPKVPVIKGLNYRQGEWFDKADLKWFDDSGKIIPPKDYNENLRYRVWLRGLENKGIDDDHKIKAELMKRAKEDIVFFFNTFLWTQDPRKRPADLPFVTYDFEDKFILWSLEHILKGKDCLIEKSRDMGISWSICGIILHQWMFVAGFLSHVGSKKEDDVDRSGDIRSLFEKLRYLLRELPDWMRPYGFNWKQHSMFMRLINPVNSNSITGESANRDFGRAGRYSLCVLDEFASMEYSEESWTATGDSTPCRIATSTPKGTGNKFWQLRFKSKIDYFTAHWSLHPEKSKGVKNKEGKDISSSEAFDLWKKGEEVTSPWYENEKERRLTQESQSKIDIAQELDIDYIASGNPYFDIKSLMKQEEWQETDDWLNFDNKRKVIIGTLTEIDGHLEFRPNKNGWLRLFEKPRDGAQYVIGLDSAEGLEHGDYSSGACRDKKTRNLIAGIYGHYDYDELSYFGFLLSRYFNSALICAEAGGYGAAVNKRLYDLGANVGRAVDFSTGTTIEKDKLGWINSTVSRPKALADLEAEIRERACEIRDKDLKTEMMNFINKDGKPQASDGANDDYIWSFAIAGQLLRFRPYSEEIEKRARNKNRIIGIMPKINMGFSFKK